MTRGTGQIRTNGSKKKICKRTWRANDIVEGECCHPRAQLEEQRERLSNTASGSEDGDFAVLSIAFWNRSAKGTPLPRGRRLFPSRNRNRNSELAHLSSRGRECPPLDGREGSASGEHCDYERKEEGEAGRTRSAQREWLRRQRSS